MATSYATNCRGRFAGAVHPSCVLRLAKLELTIVGSALRFLAGGWRRPLPAGFSYHRESGLRFVLALLPLLAVGDILLLELVILPHAQAWLRILLHALGAYGLLWLVGMYATARTRPHQLVGDQLVLHRAALKRLVVPVDQIVSIEPLPSFADDWKKRAYLKGAIRLDLAGPTILELRLRDASRVVVAVDDPRAFTAAVGTLAR
jgi:hypothetical protein